MNFINFFRSVYDLRLVTANAVPQDRGPFRVIGIRGLTGATFSSGKGRDKGEGPSTRHRADISATLRTS